MDEQSEAFFKLIFYMMIAPFWLAWKIIQLLWGLYKSLKEDIDQKSAQAQYGLESDAAVQAQKLRDEEREKQLAQIGYPHHSSEASGLVSSTFPTMVAYVAGPTATAC
jgi:hypothetical protein